ncbi:PEGA domain-containing protein [Polyangium aurulentum]|uniref:PEGA domain-containing protein n=1 Tax=Polyangium aurulentum TaxID=2567896 RepID=UPI0010AE023F|nr:PEGA domain-containing protein [Polyangium aurulentum]UQA57783.1 PEGA domain-containing protein [Polyangium aurulentum]
MTSSITCDLAAIACSVAIALWASEAHAQEPAARDPVAAEALFKAGRTLVKQGDYAAGCPKFEASLALNPSASTMINIALCHEHEGKIASAWEDYHRAIVLNRETAGEQRKRDLEDIAKKGIAALEPRVPKLVVTVEPAPEGLEVRRDGKPLPKAALGEALPADPGPHEVRASAPGHEAETQTVTLEEGKTATVKLTLRAGSKVEPDAKTGGGVPTWAWISGAVGIGLTGAAVGFLVDDLSAISALRENCREVRQGTYCNPGYDYAADNARKNRDFGLFVGLGSAGVIAIGAAIVGIATAGSAKEPARTAIALPWVAPDSAGATLVGSF